MTFRFGVVFASIEVRGSANAGLKSPGSLRVVNVVELVRYNVSKLEIRASESCEVLIVCFEKY